MDRRKPPGAGEVPQQQGEGAEKRERRQLWGTFEADRPRWVVVHVGAGREKRVTDHLREEGYEVLYLWRRIEVRRRGRVALTVERSLLPRYIFAAIVPMLGQSVAEINRQDYVSTVLHIRGEPVEIPLAVIRELRARGDQFGLVPEPDEKPKARSKLWAKGSRVAIDDPLGTFLAEVESDDGHKVTAWAGRIRLVVAGARVRDLVGTDVG